MDSASGVRSGTLEKQTPLDEDVIIPREKLSF
jgi:hypothetical protein